MPLFERGIFVEEKETRKKRKPSKKMLIRNDLIERGQEARIVRRIVSVIFLLFLIATMTVGYLGFRYVSLALQPLDPENTKLTDITIPIGSSTTTIGKILEENGIIKDANIFKYYVKFNNISGFQAGNYQFSPAMTLEEITASLQTGKIILEPIFHITIPEGYTLEQIAERIAKHTEHTEEEILKTMDDPNFIKELQRKYPDLLTDEIFDERLRHPLEGYLFPATYPFYEENPSIEYIIETMLKQTRTVIQPYKAMLDEMDMTVHELLTFSSLVEKEAPKEEDRRLIASVFYNRLEIDMPLQTDPTVAYAIGQHLERTLDEHLAVDSPFNTYKYKGLPPGPIANSGKTSIIAVLDPAESDYLYFLAEYGTDTVHYSKTLAEHEEKAKKYIYDKRREAEQNSD